MSATEIRQGSNRQPQQWTIQSMLLWILVIALAIPYVLAMVPISSNPVTKFGLDGNEILAWLQELDPNAELSSGGGGGFDGQDAYNQDHEYCFLSKTLTEKEMFDQIEQKMQQKINAGNWSMKSFISAGNDNLGFHFVNSFAAYRVYIWKIPLNESDQGIIKFSPANAIRIKTISIGYSAFHGRWPAREIDLAKP